MEHIWEINNGAAAEGGTCVSDYFISQIFIAIPYIFHIYFLNISHLFPLACFSVYGVKNNFGHEQMTRVGQISHASVPKLTF